MIIRSTGNDLDTAVHQTLAECLRIVHDVLLVYLKFRLKRFFEADCLCRDHMHERATLDAREDRFV